MKFSHKLLCFLFIFTIQSFLFTKAILASDRNIFGLHLTQPSDLTTAAPVINSSNGDWGWVTIVIRLDQLDHNTWQDFFDNCRKLHLIPIIRLASIMENDSWKRPDFAAIDSLATFLNSLNWPSKQQYVLLFNEINHGSEWGGSVDIKNYADIAIYTATKFKTLNPNFYIIGGGLDLAAPDKMPGFASAVTVYREIYLYRPDYFSLLDGLSSHSYPNHGFIGTPDDTGQHSIRGYQWELNYLKTLGVTRNYPIFITETGWPHREGESKNNQFYTTETTAKFLNQALNIWQQDDRVLAVTPFIYNFPHPPFDHFSWLDQNEHLYPNYQIVIGKPKNKNIVEQITSYQVTANHLPFLLFSGNDYSGQITLKNTGQSIWGEKQFCLSPQTTINVSLDAICTGNRLIYPGQTEIFNYKLKINPQSEYSGRTFISWDGLPQFEISPLYGSSSIFSPKTSVKDKVIQYFQSFFI